MAKDGERRKSFWEEEEENSAADSKTAKPTPGKTSSLGIGSGGPPTSESVDLKIHDAKVLMEQTHQLYLQYFNGVEKRPPKEKSGLLESRIKELERFSMGTAAARFKVSQFLIQYKTMRDLWDRRLRDKENGK